jgi:hypothetical protein
MLRRSIELGATTADVQEALLFRVARRGRLVILGGCVVSRSGWVPSQLSPTQSSFSTSSSPTQ